MLRLLAQSSTNFANQNIGFLNNPRSKSLKTPGANLLKFPNNPNSYPFKYEDFLNEELIFSNQKSVVEKYLHSPSGRELAIKFIRIHYHQNHRLHQIAQNSGKLKELQNEIEIHQKVATCSEIVSFYGFCIFEGHILICMELMDMSLRDFYLWLHRAKIAISEEVLWHIIVSVIKALKVCKENSVMHRDIKPLNILMNSRGEIKLCDFGASRILDDSMASSLVGTVAYWPPERFTDFGLRYDFRAEIWSLGVTILEFIVGKLPYTQNEIDINIYSIPNLIKEYKFSENRMLETYSEDLKSFIEFCLKSVSERPTVDMLFDMETYKRHENYMLSEEYYELVKRAIESKNSLIPDPSLLSAARENNIDLVRTLLEQCADPNIKDDYGNTALHLAACNKDDNKWLVELLLEYGADIDSQDKYGVTCLMKAAINNNIEIAHCFLQNGADINRKNKISENVLHYTARNENDNKFIIELLLKQGADINSQAEYGNTCLMWAAFNNNIEIVRCLLQNGADINAKDIDGANVLHYAVENKNDNKLIIELLLKNGADIDSQNEYGDTCLMWAAFNNNIEIVRCLLQNGADINAKDIDGANVLHYAVENKNDNKFIIKLLLEYGADINNQSKDGYTCLMWAAIKNNIEIVRCLLQNGANIDSQNENGYTCLMIAVNFNNIEIVRCLLQNDADIDSQNKNGDTCLMTAARNNNIEIVRFLLQNGADINKKGSGGENVLHCAAVNKNDNKLIIELLLKYGADIDSQNENGVTCLMWAAIKNNIKIVRCLLQNGADINKQNRFGETALQMARRNRKDNKEIVELLLDYEREKSKTFFNKDIQIHERKK